MKKTILFIVLLSLMIFPRSDLRAHWEIGGSVSGSADFAAPGLRLETRRFITLPLEGLDAAFQMSAQMQFPQTNVFIRLRYIHPSIAPEAYFPPTVMIIESRRLGAGAAGMLRYHLKRLGIYTGLGLHVMRLNRTLLEVKSPPYCTAYLCEKKFYSFMFPEQVTQYSWSQHYGLEFRLSRRLNPFVEYSYYQAFKTEPFDDGLLRNHYGRLALGVRVPLSR